MPTVERLYDRGARRATKALMDTGEEFRHARLRLGLSQRAVAEAARIDRADYSRIEAGKLTRLSVSVAYRAGAVLGLDLSLRAYPGGWSVRDAGQAKREQRVIAAVGLPLRWQMEVPITRQGGSHDQRGWDLVVTGLAERTGFEFETKLYDLQAQQRRWNLKRRDDPVDHFVVVVADTRANRRILAEFADLLAELPRHRTATLLATLRRGEHPLTGIVLI
ncbi:MAG: helix-turn-helix transcriptional regulator [Chloroflexota bacterium]